MRDLLHTRYSSSTKAKARARRQLREDHYIHSPLPPLPLRVIEYKDPPEYLPRRAVPSRTSSVGHDIGDGYRFAMADAIFSKDQEDSGRVGTTRPILEVDLLEPLPLEASIVDIDLDNLETTVDVSEESFRAAINML